MKVTQIYNIVNAMANEILGKPNWLGNDGNVYTNLNDVPGGVTTTISYEIKEDLSNIVDVGKKLLDNTDTEQLFKVLINHIGRVIFVNREYTPIVPSILKDGWEYGSILEKIDSDMPESVSDAKWALTDGQIYEQDKYSGPKGVRMKLFNKAVSYQIAMSFTGDQLKQSFSNVEQLNAFMSMVQTKIKNRMTIDYANLIRSTINNFISATVYRDYNAVLDDYTHEYTYGDVSYARTVNLLALYRQEGNDTANELTISSALKDLNFLKFASYTIMRYSDKLKDMSTVFNIGGKERFTPADLQHIVLLADFADSASVYLQSDTFHDQLVKLPKAETVNYWQGIGQNYDINSVSKIHTVATVTADGNNMVNKESIVEGIIGVMFDHDALGVNNERNQTTSHYNANGDFFNYWYKSFARYFNDYDENFVVFIVA